MAMTSHFQCDSRGSIPRIRTFVVIRSKLWYTRSMKICSKCQVEKSPSEFYRKKGTPDGLYYHCKLCQNEYGKNHYSGNTDYYKTKARKWDQDNLGKKYGLSVLEYQELFSKFDGLCWICKDNRATDVDHDHTCCPYGESCGKCVRGALCNLCNRGLGYFQDNADRVRKASEYLNASVV